MNVELVFQLVVSSKHFVTMRAQGDVAFVPSEKMLVVLTELSIGSGCLFLFGEARLHTDLRG